MKNLGKMFLSLIIVITFTLSTFWMSSVWANEFFVYHIYKALEMGGPAEIIQKDYYINMGSSQGLKIGDQLEVLRKAPTSNQIEQKFYQDVTFPIAKLKVIHVEKGAAITRLEQMLDAEKTAAITPKSVMLGDFVRKL